MESPNDTFIRFENDILHHQQLNSIALKLLNMLTSKLYTTKRSINNIVDEMSELQTLIDTEKVKIEDLTNVKLSVQLDRIKAEVCSEDEKNNMSVYIKMMEEHKVYLSKVFAVEPTIKLETKESVYSELSDTNMDELIRKDEIERAELSERLLRAESKCAMMKKRNAATIIRLTKRLEALETEKYHLSNIPSKAIKRCT